MNQKISVEQLCGKLKPVLGKRIDDIYLKYVMAESSEEREEIAHILNALYHKNLGELLDTKVLLEPPKSELRGEYPLGMISYAGNKIGDFNLREQDFSRHVCISGMSGSGKTTFAINLVNNFIKQGKSFLVFDWKKSFRPLLLADNEVMCFTVGNNNVSNLFKININEPPKGIDPKEWINVLCDLLVESFSASFGVHKVLLETLDEAFKQWGVYEGSDNYPTWENIKWYLEEKMEKIKGREAGWVESALRIASVLTFGNFGEVCCSKDNGLSIEDIMDKKIILELNALSNIEKKFFCEFILTYIYKFKKANQRVSGNFDHAIVVDEAHNVFLKSATHFVKESVTDMVYREMREYGTGLICIDQHISKLSDTVKGNSACHVAFGQQLPADIYDIAGLMQLQEYKQYFCQLPVGSAIVKLSERYTFPFLIEVEQSRFVGSIVDDEKVKSRADAMICSFDFEKNVDEKFNKEIVSPKFDSALSGKNPVEDSHIVREEKELEDKPCVVEEKESAPFSGKNPIPVKMNVYYDRVQAEPKKEDIGSQLSDAEYILLDFVNKKLSEGMNLVKIENFLVENSEGRYTGESVMKVINYVLKNQLNVQNVIPENEQQNQKIYNDVEVDSENLQKMFVAFLCENRDKDYGTVDIYKQLGLSSRKGNKIKNELLERGLISVEEVRNERGWKKVIRPVVPLVQE